MLNSEQSVSNNTSHCCELAPLPIDPIQELPQDSTVSFIIATAVLIRAVTELIQVLLMVKRQKPNQ